MNHKKCNKQKECYHYKKYKEEGEEWLIHLSHIYWDSFLEIEDFCKKCPYWKGNAKWVKQ